MKTYNLKLNVQETDNFADIDFRVLIDSVQSALFILDDQATILDLNKSAEKLGTSKLDESPRRLCGDFLDCVHAKKSS